MPYINPNGGVVEKRSLFRLSLLSDAFWGVVNLIGLFFQTIINPKKPIPKRDRSNQRIASRGVSSSSSNSGGSGGGGNGGLRNRGSNIRTLPSNRNDTSTCSSCG